MIGQNIGKYRVLDRVGRGGMGTVYRAIDETLHREVAIKVLNAELNDPEVARRFRAEAITVARLSHPGIATIYELFQHDGQWLMVMEFVRGETLERLIERAGPQTPERSAELCMHSLAALAHAHSMGVVHRDLKPANIMLTENGVIKIMDFGIARVAGTEHLTNAGFMMGTPAYMAPEQVLGHEIDARSDLYAMGVVFYRLLTGQLPFRGDTPFAMAQAQVNNPPTPVGTIRAGLPPWVDEVMVKSLAKKPDDRFQSAVEFHEGFSRSLSGQPMPAAYRSSAPTSIMMTPPHPMPTGTVAQTMVSTPRTGTSIPVPSVGIGASGAVRDDLSGVGPTISGGTPVAVPRPSTGAVPVTSESGRVPSSAVYGGDDPSGVQTVLSPSGAQAILSPSGAQAVIAQSGARQSDLFGSATPPPSGFTEPGVTPSSVSSVTPAQNAAGSQLESARPVPSSSTKKSSTGLIAAAAGLVIVLGVGAFVMFRSGRAQPAVDAAPVNPEVVTTDAAPTVDPVAAPGSPPTPPVVAPPVTGAPARGAPGPGGTVAGAPPAGTTGTTSPSSTSAARGTDPVAPTDEPLLAVSDVRVLVVDGRKASDQEVLLNFVGGQVVIVNRRSGAPIASLPYKSIAGATYIHARDPRWNPALASPPTGLDVGGMLRTSKHYLTLQGTDAYQILRLEDVNVMRVLQAVEARTGITIERPRSNDRN